MSIERRRGKNKSRLENRILGLNKTEKRMKDGGEKPSQTKIV